MDQTNICIETKRGQDCLEFTRAGQSPGKRWDLSNVISKIWIKPRSEQTVTIVPTGLTFNHQFVGQTAYDQVI